MLWAVLCAPAAAAQVSVAPACPSPLAPVRLTTTGLAGLSPYTVTVDGRTIGAGTADETGAASATFPAPATQGASVVRVADLLGNRGRAALVVARPAVDLVPSPRRPWSRVRFDVRAFGQGESVWLHRVDPLGRLRSSARLGTATGTCGDLTSAPIRVVPRRPTRGRWRLQIDTRMTYDPRETPRVVQDIRVG